MIAHERLPGPLPLKNKDWQNGGERGGDGKVAGKEIEKLSLSQIRRPQYPIGYLSKRTHRSGYNHFQRHADIKSHGKIIAKRRESVFTDSINRRVTSLAL